MRLDNPNHGGWNAKGTGHHPAHVKNNLRGAGDYQSSIGILRAKCCERFHMCLLHGLRVVCTLNHNVAVLQNGIHIPVRGIFMVDQIAPVVAFCPRAALPGVLRMNNHRIIQSLVKIQDRFQSLVGNFDLFQRLADRLLIISDDDSRDIPDMPHVAVEDEPVVRTCLRIGLSGLCKTR